MADDDENAPAAPAAASGGIVGPLAAILLVAAAAVATVVIVLWSLSSGTRADAAVAAGPDGAKAPTQAPLIDGALSVDLKEVMSNVRGEGLRRYVKVNVMLWFDASDHARVQSRVDIQVVLKGALEQRLHGFSLEQLGEQTIHRSLQKAFTDEANAQLRRLLGITDPSRMPVREVTLSGLLVQ